MAAPDTLFRIQGQVRRNPEGDAISSDFSDEHARRLLARMAAGERAAMDRYYVMLQEPAFRLARIVTLNGERAADQLLGLMLEHWQRPARLPPDRPVLDGVLAEMYRRSAADAAEAAEPAVQIEAPADLARWIERLPVHQRAGLHLAFHDDLSDARIAYILGRGEAEVRVAFGEALTRLVAEFGGAVGAGAGDARSLARERHRFLMHFRYALRHPPDPSPGDFVLDLLNRRIDALQRRRLWPMIGRWITAGAWRLRSGP